MFSSVLEVKKMLTMVVVRVDHSFCSFLVSVDHFVSRSEVSLFKSLLGSSVSEENMALHSLSEFNKVVVLLLYSLIFLLRVMERKIRGVDLEFWARSYRRTCCYQDGESFEYLCEEFSILSVRIGEL